MVNSMKLLPSLYSRGRPTKEIHNTSQWAKLIICASWRKAILKLHLNLMGMLVVEKPLEFQGEHEEADSLLAFHAFQTGGNILVGATDSDVLVILFGLFKKLPPLSMICMNIGAGNKKQLIRVSDVATRMEEQQSRLSKALIGFPSLGVISAQYSIERVNLHILII